MNYNQTHSILFSPIQIGPITVANRFVRSATHAFMSDADGYVTERQIKLLEDLAKGEVGLIVSGHAFIHRRGKASLAQTAVYDDRFVPGLQRMAEAVHRFSSRIFLQLAHAGRQTKEKLAGGIPVAPSAVYEPVFKITPHILTELDIQALIQGFVESAQRAKEAGFDGVQLHLAHGYLLSSFLSPHTNRRSDQWGGALANRMRIILQIIQGIQSGSGRDFPVMVKMNSTDLLPKGLNIEEAKAAAVILERAGIHAIEVSGGMSEAGRASVWKGPFTEAEEGYFLENAFHIKSAVTIPVLGLGGFRTFAKMEKAVQEGRADMISMSRPFIRTPDLIYRFKTGKINKSDCISCNKCFNPRGIECGDLKTSRSSCKTE
jgi:2,4-dienoyl-CoA reductase-like NADH-dependent reductase (Old Yellow Enzyme family)